MASIRNYSWKLFCVTENMFVSGVHKHRLIICPNDSNHTVDINTSSYELIQNTTNITDNNKNLGYYSIKGITFQATGAASTTYEITYPFDITIISGKILCEPENKGDILNTILAPNKICGIVTQNANINDTVVYVDPNVIDNVVKELEISFGSRTEIYIIIDVNIMDSSITLSTPLITTLSFMDYVHMNIKIINNFTYPSTGMISIGNFNPFDTYLTRNNIIRFIYTNNSNYTKTVNFYLECY